LEGLDSGCEQFQQVIRKIINRLNPPPKKVVLRSVIKVERYKPKS
jgi:hypothetical protein